MFKSFIIGLTTVAAVGLAAVAGIPQASAADPCTNGKLDNCYTKAQMKDFLAVIDKMVLGYMDKIGVPEDSLPTVVYVPEGEIETTECVTSSDGSHDETDEAYAYCASDNKIFIGQSQLWSFYQDYGAVGPTTGLAHEYGHFLQALTGVPQPESNKDSITHENQADCISGSFVSYLDDKGDVDYPGDYKNLAGLAFEIASAEGPNRDHGTVDERVGSFVIGFYGDLSACQQIPRLQPRWVCSRRFPPRTRQKCSDGLIPGSTNGCGQASSSSLTAAVEVGSDGELTIYVREPAVDGKANNAVTRAAGGPPSIAKKPSGIGVRSDVAAQAFPRQPLSRSSSS